MKINNSRYVSFWSNPEMYRLQYEQNLVPAKTAAPLAIGQYFHALKELDGKTVSGGTVDLAAIDASEKEQQVAKALYNAHTRKYHGDTRIEAIPELTEYEFDVPIPGSSHSIIGRWDGMIWLNQKNSRMLWLRDYKTANEKATEFKKEEEFKLSSQPLFYINAARALGHAVEGIFYNVVTKHATPQIYEIFIRKSEYELQSFWRQAHITCETIEMYRDTFGIDNPWPHRPQSYPCNYKDLCEYKGICGRAKKEWSEDDLSFFKPREESYEVLK